jgi:hypothetical protein
MIKIILVRRGETKRNERAIIKRAEALAKIALNVWRNLKDATYE